MKKIVIPFLISGGIILIIFISFKCFSSPLLTSLKKDEVMILKSLPFGIEPHNPIPEVRYWNFANKTYYYFNWGLKPTGGYNLEFVKAANNLITLKAVTPKKDQMVIQVLTFPHLLISLPKGNYTYVVNDEAGQPDANIFQPKNPPLKLTVFLPKEGQIARREILRDPYLNNEGKATILIALEALFNQAEMSDFLERGVLPQEAAFSSKEKKWHILLSKAFTNLDREEKGLLTELITKTVLALKLNHPSTVEITTEPSQLSALKD